MQYAQTDTPTMHGRSLNKAFYRLYLIRGAEGNLQQDILAHFVRNLIIRMSTQKDSFFNYNQMMQFFLGSSGDYLREISCTSVSSAPPLPGKD